MEDFYFTVKTPYKDIQDVSFTPKDLKDFYQQSLDISRSVE